MGKRNKNYEKPDRVIDLFNGYNGIYCIRRIGKNGESSMDVTSKNAGKLIPFIESGAYKYATLRAKESLLEFPSDRKIRGLIKKLIVV